MIITIDTREQELFNKCEYIISNYPKFKDIKLVSKPLHLGDFIINDGSNDCVIVERKTLNDLAASIKDGRYEEQSYRLNGLEHHNHNIVYLIEGDMSRFNVLKNRIDKLTLYSAMTSIHYFKGFSVMRSINIEETAIMACNMVYKLVGGLKGGKKGYYATKDDATKDDTTKDDATKDDATKDDATKDDATKDDATKDDATKDDATKAAVKNYCSVIKKVKKDNINPDNIGEIMLCQIPGVSSSSALAILSKFNTLPKLISCLKQDDKCLNDICTIDSNGKSRKVSKTALATVVKFLKE